MAIAALLYTFVAATTRHTPYFSYSWKLYEAMVVQVVLEETEEGKTSKLRNIWSLSKDHAEQVLYMAEAFTTNV